MLFKQRFNCFFRQINGHRNGLVLEITPGEFALWLGCIDRTVARSLPGAQQIALDFAGWRLKELDPWQWLEAKEVIVGCLIEKGVMAVLDGERPLLKELDYQPIPGRGR